MANSAEMHISPSEQEARFSTWKKEASSPEVVPPQDTIFEQWKDVIPRSQYGEISITKVSPQFMSGYKEALRNGNVESFTQQQISENGYEGIYVAKSTNPTSEADARIVHHHSSEFLDQTRDSLLSLHDKVISSQMPDLYKKEYVNSINGELQFNKAAKGLVTPEFTKNYKSPEGWAELLDVEKSFKEGTVVLKYEDVAREVLKRSNERRAKKGEKDVPVKHALEFWNLSEKERKKLGFEEISSDALELNAEQGKKLFEVLFNRIGLIERGWKVVVDEKAAAVNVSAKSKEVQIPSDRRIKGWDVRNIPGHETVHAVRGENGEKQGLKLLGEGVSDYIKTEEGAGVIAEMVLGEEFGDDRQVKFAARYIAVAMAMKAKRVNGEIAPQYSMQEIYNHLKENGVSEVDAGDIIWRIVRGTSLKHEGLMLSVKRGNSIQELPSAECFPKDTVYFEGQMEVFNWMKNQMPLIEGQRKGATTGNVDFSDKLLARVGRAMEVLGGEGRSESTKEAEGKNLSISEKRGRDSEERTARYAYLVDKGRDTLIELLNVLGKGKMRLDFLESESGWNNYLKKDGLVNYKNILNPVE